MIYEIYHKTEYRYSESVSISNHTIHLEPRALNQQTVQHCLIDIFPRPLAQRKHVDYFGNHMLFFTIEEPHLRLQITARSRVLVFPTLTPHPKQTPAWEQARDRIQSQATKELEVAEFIYKSPLVPKEKEIQDYTLLSFLPGRPLLDAALDLNHRIFMDFEFDSSATTVSTPVMEVFQNRRGVCQDFAHLMLACYRSIGLAARYVSGYVRTEPAPGRARIFGADASHAWTSLYCPDYGWIDLDPTNDCLGNQDYITLGWGRDYGDVSLIRGVLSGGGDHSLFFSVNVQPEGLS